jgi:hypothetical protein
MLLAQDPAKAFSLPINDDLSSANYSNKALANLVE